LLQRFLNRLASPIALSATATEHGGQLVSAVDWTLRLLCKMCVCGFANCALAVLMFNKNRAKQTQNITVPSPLRPLPNRIRSTVQGVNHCNSEKPLQQSRGWSVATRRDHCNSPRGGPLQLGGAIATVRGRTVANRKGHCNGPGGRPLQLGGVIATVQRVDRCHSEGPSQQSRGWTVATRRGHCNSPAGGPLQLGGAIATVQGVD